MRFERRPGHEPWNAPLRPSAPAERRPDCVEVTILTERPAGGGEAVVVAIRNLGTYPARVRGIMASSLGGVGKRSATGLVAYRAGSG